MKRTTIIIIICAAILFCGAILYRHFTLCKAAKAEQNVQTVSNSAELYSLFWRQSHSNADKCFTFSFGTTKHGAKGGGHYLNCEFSAPNGELTECEDIFINDER